MATKLDVLNQTNLRPTQQRSGSVEGTDSASGYKSPINMVIDQLDQKQLALKKLNDSNRRSSPRLHNNSTTGATEGNPSKMMSVSNSRNLHGKTSSFDLNSYLGTGLYSRVQVLDENHGLVDQLANLKKEDYEFLEKFLGRKDVAARRGDSSTTPHSAVKGPTAVHQF